MLSTRHPCGGWLDRGRATDADAYTAEVKTKVKLDSWAASVGFGDLSRGAREIQPVRR